MPTTYITNITAITMDAQNTIFDDATIVIVDERITFVGPSSAPPALAVGAEIIDGAGMVAIPGLVNAHTHVAMTLFRGAGDDLPLMTWLTEHIWPVEARMTDDDVYWGSLLGVAEMLRAGVTSFQDMYWHLPATARAVRESGIRACLSGPIIGAMPGNEDAVACAAEQIRAINGENNPLLTACFGPHAPYTVPPAMLTQIIDAAGELGVRINIHLAETAGEVAGHIAQYGATPVKHLHQLGLFNVPVTAAHCVHFSPEEIEILAAADAVVAHCPSSNMKLGSGIAPVPALLRAGVPVALGSDGAGSNNTLDILREVRQAALLHKVMGDTTAVSAAQALRMATVSGAAALGHADIGVLAPGKLADITLLDFNCAHLQPSAGRQQSHLAYAASGHDVNTVIVHGKVLLRNHQLTTIDEKLIFTKVEEIARRLF